jgi:hypothetical protein
MNDEAENNLQLDFITMGWDGLGWVGMGWDGIGWVGQT